MSFASAWSKFISWWRQPLLSLLISRRGLCVSLIVTGVVLVSLSALNLPSYTCPFRDVTGFPCPSCGLTRGVRLFVSGDWKAAIQLHPLSPVAVLTMGLVIAGILLPDSLHIRYVRLIERFERMTGITQWLLLWLWGDWIRRIISHGAI